MKLSIIIPAYNEEQNIPRLDSELIPFLKGDYEILIVDDGSNDTSFEKLRELQRENQHVKVIKLKRNYGQAIAILAGVEFAQGEVMICMDGDLQNDPHDIPTLLSQVEKGYEFVNGWRYRRVDSFVRKFISKIENMLVYMKIGIKLHDYGSGFVAGKRELFKKLKIYGENALFIKPLLVCLAKSFIEVKVKSHPRKDGKSKYNLWKISKLGVSFLFKFKFSPKGKVKYVIEEILGR